MNAWSSDGLAMLLLWCAPVAFVVVVFTMLTITVCRSRAASRRERAE